MQTFIIYRHCHLPRIGLQRSRVNFQSCELKDYLPSGENLTTLTALPWRVKLAINSTEYGSEALLAERTRQIWQQCYKARQHPKRTHVYGRIRSGCRQPAGRVKIYWEHRFFAMPGDEDSVHFHRAGRMFITVVSLCFPPTVLIMPIWRSKNPQHHPTCHVENTNRCSENRKKCGTSWSKTSFVYSRR